MVTRQNFRIAGSGRFLPPQQVSADEIDSRLGMPEGWTRKSTGVETRYECCPPHNILTMGAEAIQTAMQQAGVTWSDVDLLIDCSTSRFRPIPCNAAHFLNLFGSQTRGIPCFDVQSTCLGFLVALNTANGLLASGQYRNILVVASENTLRGANWKQPESASLIGDGAAAVVLKPATVHRPMLMRHETYTEHLELCRVDGGAHYLTPMEYTPERRGDFLFDMNGPAVFRVALGRLPRMVRTLLTEWNSMDDQSHPFTDYTHAFGRKLHVIPHQASPKALEIVRDVLESDDEHFHSQARQVGNMAAASLPFMLDYCRRERTLPADEPVLLLGTSAGYAQAAMIMFPDSISTNNAGTTVSGAEQQGQHS